MGPHQKFFVGPIPILRSLCMYHCKGRGKALYVATLHVFDTLKVIHGFTSL